MCELAIGTAWLIWKHGCSSLSLRTPSLREATMPTGLSFDAACPSAGDVLMCLDLGSCTCTLCAGCCRTKQAQLYMLTAPQGRKPVRTTQVTKLHSAAVPLMQIHNFSYARLSVHISSSIHPSPCSSHPLLR